MRLLFFSVLCSILATFLPLAAGAQEVSTPVFREAVEVRVVNLEVVVTDARGERVTGLAADDFRLFVDGEETPIDYFTEVVGGESAETPEDVEREASPVLSPGEAVGRSYVVLIDDYFSMPNDRDETVRALIEDLEHLKPHDRMAIVAFDGRNLELLSHWSSSRADLRRVLEGALERPAHGLARIAEQRPMANDPRHSVGTIDVLGERDLDTVPDVESIRELHLRRTVERMEKQMEVASSAAAAVLRSFANVPGRKVLLLLSGGWPSAPAELLSSDDSTELLAFWTDPESVFGGLIAAANRLGFTIYSIDASRERDLRESGQIRRTLELLADRTGGKAITGGDRREALALVDTDTSSYYWLGFSPDWSEDDLPREIRVEVEGEGLSVRTRENYLDLSRQRSASMLLDSALLFDQGPQRHSVPMKLGEPERARRKTVKVPLSLALPVDPLVFMPQGDRLVAELELHLGIRDENGEQPDLEPIPFEVRLRETPPSGTYVPYRTTIVIGDRPHRIVVAVRDRVGGAIVTGAAEFEPR
ncbi:MAG: VWA domain-containing protein [Thermoanaerobaculia bacterium]|nr:VWA domain-containing protein [Thermoanaerobaculia bacterium]